VRIVYDRCNELTAISMNLFSEIEDRATVCNIQYHTPSNKEQDRTISKTRDRER